MKTYFIVVLLFCMILLLIVSRCYSCVYFIPLLRVHFSVYVCLTAEVFYNVWIQELKVELKTIFEGFTRLNTLTLLKQTHLNESSLTKALIPFLSLSVYE